MRPLDILSITLVLCATAMVLVLPLSSEGNIARGFGADGSVLHYPHDAMPDAAPPDAEIDMDHLTMGGEEKSKRGDRHLFSLDDAYQQEIGDALYSDAPDNERNRTTELRYTLSDRVYRL
ncbi:hypothetical protein [Kushneria aurantia]|uniref:Uncharacterized protein n=1 Tax=Kushneria aurantia TaxID=504092 RepID=A0ABV6G1Z2_9GAMM|nr:hypothetical protein [Kushneria aurantia]